GEPLMNYKNVLAAIDKITAQDALGMSPKRITVSTSGIPKMIQKMADDEVRFQLAVSLHSARQDVRKAIMPFAQNFPLDELLKAMQYWYQKTKKRITFEYVVWEGVNDLPEDINALVAFCQRVPSKVNLIQYNSIGDPKFKQASEPIIQAYVQALEAARVVVTIRRSRGNDIDAACGQLANKTLE
ncbi:MAG: 23S rRNA (adenine(2503)-C(2))-methyltransferase RlmN, partial [Flavobacteriaceae bacterium]